MKPLLVKPLVAAVTMMMSQTVTETDGILRISNTVRCETSSACAQVCGANTCQWTEPLCRDCFGTGLEVMRDIFERASISYRKSIAIDDVTLLRALTSGQMVTISPASPYDYYTQTGDTTVGIATQLTALCGSKEGFIATQLDDENRPVRAALAICVSDKKLQAYKLETNNNETTNHLWGK